MTRVLIVAVCLVLPSTGCLLNEYSSDPNQRMLQLVNQSKDLREIEKEMERFWTDDNPSHLTPDRVHGSAPELNPPVVCDRRLNGVVIPFNSAVLTVANVLKEPVSLFVVEATGLRFVAKLPAGEPLDILVFTGQKLAVTFTSSPHCANYTVKGTADEVWLLR